MAITNFIPTIWSSRLQKTFDHALVYGSLVNRDYEGEITEMGGTVKINGISDPTVSTYVAANGITWQDLSETTPAVLTIDQAKSFSFKIDDCDKAQSNPKLMDKAITKAAYKMADTCDSYIAGIMEASATAAKTGDIQVTASNAYDTLVDLSVKLTENSVPKAGRWVVVPAFYEGLLLKDNRFVSGSEAANETLKEGYIGRAAGFDVFVSANCPATSTAKVVLAGVNEAATFANQLTEVEALRLQNSFADGVRGLNLYGACVEAPAGLVKINVKL